MKDICKNRHRGNRESVAAFNGIKKTVSDRREQVRQAIEAAGANGATVHEVAEEMGTNPNNISGRFSELKKDDVIEQIGRRPTASGSTAGVYRLKNTPPPPATHQADFGFDMFNEIYSGNPYE
tara:strand:+ start:7101 stop:7469 length:369 start_codon:yes stop_codon:yes gene_type:complete